jgi:hypothetical protein
MSTKNLFSSFRKLSAADMKTVKGGKAIDGGADCIALGQACSRAITMTGPICCGHSLCHTDLKCTAILA